MARRACYVVVMAGGTGGHVYPALAVAQQLRDEGAEVRWVGTRSGLEARLVPQAGLPMLYISMKGFAGKALLNKVNALVLLAVNTLHLLGAFIRRRPAVVIGFGGYASLPGAIAAKLLWVPLVLHEQNSRAGVANKLISKVANKTLLAFAGAIAAKRQLVTGNPVRPEICQVREQEKHYGAVINILVLGGSLGARFFNERIMAAFTALGPNPPLKVLHQCGKVDVAVVEARYRELGIEATVVQYLDNMAEVYAQTDLMVCRAGAMTVSEVVCAAIPAIFIPFPYAIYNHQYHNAATVEAMGGGFVVTEDERAVETIQAILRDLFSDVRTRLGKLRGNLLQQVPSNARVTIAQQCLEYC